MSWIGRSLILACVILFAVIALFGWRQHSSDSESEGGVFWDIETEIRTSPTAPEYSASEIGDQSKIAENPETAFTLTSDKSHRTSIRIPETADPKTRNAARDLSVYLEKIFGKTFPVETEKSDCGIIFAGLEHAPEFEDALESPHPGTHEGYAIQTSSERLLIVAASPLGFQNAVWDFLHHLGYRHFFPGEIWEIVPSLDEVHVSLDIVSVPSYATRLIFFGAGTWPELHEEVEIWRRHNRLESGFQLNTGHAYDAIVQRNKSAFDRHPEYILRNPGGDKFVVAEEGLRSLVIADSIALLKENPSLDSISLDPSDSGGWPDYSPLGTVSNQVVTLANEVADALQSEKPGVKVGIYAYNEHSPPPSIQVHPDVIVSIATSYIREGYVFEELMEKWSDRGAVLGVRDYLGVWSWDMDLPGEPLVANPRQVAESIYKYYQLGARYYVAEANHGFGPGGLGFYTATRCLWDISKKDRIDAIRHDFLEKAFRSAREPMGRFYHLIDGASSPLLSGHLLGSLYRDLDEAYQSAGNDAEVVARIDSLAAYTRFVELFREYLNAKEAARDQAFEEVASYVKRTRDLGMMHGYGMLRTQPRWDRSLSFDGEPKSFLSGIEAYNQPSHKEIRQWVRDGVARNALLDFVPQSFSRNLAPLSGNGSVAEADAMLDISIRGENHLYTYLARGESIYFEVEGGLVYGDRGPVKIRLYPLLETHGLSTAEIKVPADKTRHPVVFNSDYEGLHRIEFSDGEDVTTVFWPSRGLPLGIPSGQENNTRLHHRRHTFYFYVPMGTKIIAGHSDQPGGIVIAPDGKRVFEFQAQGAEYFQIPVEPGHDGGIWKLEDSVGHKLLMTVPSYMALSPGSLLVPRETIQ